MLERPLRVLMVSPRYLPEVGGTEMHIYEITCRLSAMGNFDITVLTTDRSRRLPREEVIAGTSVLRVPSWPRRRDYYFTPGISAVIRQHRWDLVHCQGIHTPVPLLAMISARRAGIPYLVTFHTGGHSSRLRNVVRTTQWRLAGPLSDRVSIKHLAPADRQGMATTLAESSVVAALSDYEAHPVAVMEALTVGRPVVGYDIAGVGELSAAGWVQGVPRGAPLAALLRTALRSANPPNDTKVRHRGGDSPVSIRSVGSFVAA